MPVFVLDALTDAAGNVTDPVTVDTNIEIDTIAPTISGTPAAMVGDDRNDKIAAKGETITVTFLTSEPVARPTVKIAGKQVTASEVLSLVAKTSWKAFYTPTEAGVSIPDASFDVDVLTDLAGNTFKPEVIPTGIAIDTVAATVTVGKATTSGNEGYAKEHDTITVPFATSPDLAADPTATIGGEMAKVDPNDNEATAAKEWTATYTVVAGVNVGNAAFVLDALMDAAGNVTDPVTVDTNIEIDTIAPAIVGTLVAKVGDDPDDKIAAMGETITITFAISEELVTDPTATIAGQMRTAEPDDDEETDAKEWTATYAFEVAGVDVTNARFDVDLLTDPAGNTFDPKAIPTGIAIDTIAPTVTDHTYKVNGDEDEDEAEVDDIITVGFTTSEILAETPDATIAGREAMVTGSGTSWTATYTVEAGSSTDNAAFDLGEIADAAGNTTDPVSVPSGITIDAPPPRTLTTSVSPPNSGGVRVTEVTEDGASGQTDFLGNLRMWTFPRGTLVNAAATENPGYSFDQWSGDTCEGEATADSCRITLDENKAVTAIFVAQCTLEVPETTGGDVAATDSGDNPVDLPWTGNCGDVITITATHDTNYEFDGWTGGGCGTTASCDVTVGAAAGEPRTVTVTPAFGLVERTLTTTVSPKDSGGVRVTEVTEGVSGQTDFLGNLRMWPFPHGTLVNAAATENPGYSFDQWSGDTCEGEATADSCRITLDENKAVTAIFVAQCTLEVPETTGGDVAATDSGDNPVDLPWTGNCGDVITITATHDTNYEFDGWTGGGCSTTASCDVTVGAAAGEPRTVTVTPAFGLVERTLTTTVSPKDSGGVRVAEVTEGASGLTDFLGNLRMWPFPHGTLVNAAAEANPGYRFDQWSGDTCEGEATADSCRITLDENKAVTAIFVKQCTLEVPETTGGDVAATDSGDNPVDLPWTGNCGDVITITATHDTNYEFDGWTGGGCGTTASCDVTVGTAAGTPTTVTVTPAYTAQCTLRAGAATGGSVTAEDSDGNAVTLPWKGDCGEVITIEASPATNYEFDGWTGGGCSTDAECDVTVGTAARKPTTVTVTPSFGLVERTLTTSVSPKDSGGVRVAEVTEGASGLTDDFLGGLRTWKFDHGKLVNASAQANSGYVFGSWSAGSCTGETSATRCHITMDANKAVTALFISQCTLKVPDATGGSVTAEDSSGNDVTLPWTGDCGEVITIEASPATNYEFDGWTGGGCSTDAECDVTVGTAARKPTTVTVTPSFGLVERTLTTSVSPKDSGGVRVAEVTEGASGLTDDFLGGLRTWKFDHGKLVNASAQANSGYVFGSWSAGSCTGETSATRCHITMDANKAVTALFISQCTLKVPDATGGSVTAEDSSGNDVTLPWTGDCGEVITIEASPATNYEFDGWTGGGCSTDAECDVTVGTAARKPTTVTVTPSFTREQCTLTVEAGTGGSVDPTGITTVDCGTTVAISADADDGYRFGSWSGSVADANAASTTVEVDDSQKVTANFVQQCTLTVRKGTGGTVDPTGTITLDCGTTVSISATANDGYRFSGWTGDLTSTSASTTILVDTDKTVSANFIQQCTLSVSANPTAGGTVDPEEDTIDCGKVHRVVATANDGYCFDSWKSIFGSAAEDGEGAEGENEDAEDMVDEGASGQDTCRSTSTGTLQSRANNPVRVFQAIFRKHEHRLTITTSSVNGGAGTVTPAPGTHTYPPGEKVTISAAGIFGATHQWGGACSGFAATCEVTMDGHRSVSVTFHGSGFGSEEDEEEDTLAE